MTELEQLAADADAAPFRVVLGHSQNQRLKLWIETGSASTTPATERRPLSAHQFAVPTQDRLWLDQHSDPSCPADSPAQRGDDRPISHAELRSLDLTAQDAQLMAEEQQLGIRLTHSQPDVGNVKQQAKT
jgi:hypothetical protein